MSKTAAEAEREVEASRGELDRTMEALKDKMTPGQLLDEAMRTMGGAGNQILSKFVDQAKENPMPLAVMGVGLAWLMTSNNSKAAPASFQAPRSFAPDETDADGPFSGMSDRLQARTDGISDRLQDAADGLSDKARSMTQGASSAVSGAGDRISGAASGAMQSAREATGKVAAMAGDAAGTAGELAKQAQQRAADLIAREPLILGAGGLALGLALGAALPATEVERRYIGPVRDSVVEKTKAVAEDRLEDVKDAAQAAYEGAKSSLQSGAQDAQQGSGAPH